MSINGSVKARYYNIDLEHIDSVKIRFLSSCLLNFISFFNNFVTGYAILKA